MNRPYEHAQFPMTLSIEILFPAHSEERIRYAWGAPKHTDLFLQLKILLCVLCDLCGE